MSNAEHEQLRELLQQRVEALESEISFLLDVAARVPGKTNLLRYFKEGALYEILQLARFLDVAVQPRVPLPELLSPGNYPAAVEGLEESHRKVVTR